MANLLLFLIFLFAAAILSAAFFLRIGSAALDTWGPEYRLMVSEINRTLGIFSFAALLIVTWGGMTLFFFRNRKIACSLGICKIFGMKRQDLCLFAVTDWLILGITAGLSGSLAGFKLAEILTKRLFPDTNLLSFTPVQIAHVLFSVNLLLSVLTFGGSLSAFCAVYEKKYATLFLDREESENNHPGMGIFSITIFLLLLLAARLFPDAWQINNILLLICGLLAGILFCLFRFFFSFYSNCRRNRHPLRSPRDVSLCFLCSRNTRAAGLAAMISVGALLLCFAGNLIFNFSGILRESYRKNMGYTVCLRVTDWQKRTAIGQMLAENGYTYTCLYSKLMDYHELDSCETMNGKFWAAVIHEQTDNNPHFQTPRYGFLAEKFFSGQLGLKQGAFSDALGDHLQYIGELTDNQALSLISYNFLVNESDWKYDLDNSYSCVYLLDISKSEEERLRQLSDTLPCETETASELVDTLCQTMKTYFSIVILMFVMLLAITTAFYFTTIQSDLRQRETEFLLYRIYGASKQTVKGIFLGEYLWIGFIASFCVIFVEMLLFELFFYFFLRRHYPLSLPVLLITTLFVNGFIFLCCTAANLQVSHNRQTEIIRDEV